MAAPTDLPRRSASGPLRVFLDAAFIVALRARHEDRHRDAAILLRELLLRCQAGEAELFTSVLVLDECILALARVLYQRRGDRRAWRQLDKAARKRSLRDHAGELQAMVQELCAMPELRIAEVTAEDVQAASTHLVGDGYTLEPRDAFHLAVMSRLGVGAIVTNDPDFSAAPWVTVIGFGPPHQAPRLAP